MRRHLPCNVMNENLLIGTKHTEDIIIVNNRLASAEKQIAVII